MLISKTKIIVIIVTIIFVIGVSYFFTTQQNKEINFAAVGDVGTSADSLKTLRNIKDVNPEVILFAGDLSYTTAEEWFEMTDFLGTDRIHIAIGNVDRGIRENLKNDYLKHYGLDSEFYSFDYENVHFIALSHYTDYDLESEQYMFLIDDLKLASVDPNIDWIIVWFHEPMYTDGVLPIDYDQVNRMNSFRNVMQPIFDLYGVDLVLQGHLHFYERTKPLGFNNIITDDSTFSYIKSDGQIYVTVGMGGVHGEHRHKFTKASEWSVAQNDVEFGILNIKLLNNGEKLFAEFLTNKGVVRDAFQICVSVCE